MQISDMIDELKKIKKQGGNLYIRNFKFEAEGFSQEYYLNSLKDKDKKMTRAEFRDFCKKKNTLKNK